MSIRISIVSLFVFLFTSVSSQAVTMSDWNAYCNPDRCWALASNFAECTDVILHCYLPQDNGWRQTACEEVTYGPATACECTLEAVNTGGTGDAEMYLKEGQDESDHQEAFFYCRK